MKRKLISLLLLLALTLVGSALAEEAERLETLLGDYRRFRVEGETR